MSLKILYKAIAYLRLSKEDGDEAESNSIRNQRILIEDYVKRQADIKLIGEKVDDGYSGVNFDRPGFQEMMELIRDGKVNCVIVKDLSRFARNFVESGKYLQQIFPFLNVRFIAINDNYDSLKADYQTSNLYVPIKNLFNDAYSRDVSIKMRSFYDYKKRNGMPTCAFAVYGYRREKGSKKLLVDENVAGVIQSIAAAKLFGLSLQQIADKLNEQQVLCPAEYKRSISPNYKCGPRKKLSANGLKWRSAGSCAIVFTQAAWSLGRLTGPIIRSSVRFWPPRIAGVNMKMPMKRFFPRWSLIRFNGLWTWK